MDPSIAGKKRHLTLTRAAEILGVDAPTPSTHAPELERELYLVLLIEALAEHVATLEATAE